MADDVAVALAELKGTLGVIKAWGIGIAGIVSAIGLASLGYLVAVNSQISDLKVQVDGIKSFQQDETKNQLSKIQEDIGRLLTEKKSSSSSKQPTGQPKLKE